MARIRRVEPTSDVEGSARIIQAFAAKREPLRQADLARSTGMSHQLVRHHLNKMADMGLVFASKDGTYVCQAAFVDPAIGEVVFHNMSSIVAVIEDGLTFPEGFDDGQKATLLAEAVRTFLERFTIGY